MIVLKKIADYVQENAYDCVITIGCGNYRASSLLHLTLLSLKIKIKNKKFFLF